MRCQPGGVRYEPCSPPMPARAVETGQAATASPPSNQVAIWRSASTTSSRSGNADGAPRRPRPSRASSSARVELDSIGAVTRALCHIGQPRRYSLVPIFRTQSRTGSDPAVLGLSGCRLPPIIPVRPVIGPVERAVVVRVAVVGTAISPIAVAVGAPATAIAVADVLDREGRADDVNFGKGRGGSPGSVRRRARRRKSPPQV